MEQAAAFRASYADWKLIKTRSVIQIVLEVPIEQADRAYQVLGGMPAPGAEQWCAVARLNEGVKVAPELPVEAAGSCGETPDRPHFPRMPVSANRRLAQQAGMLCADPVFRAFLNEEGPIGIGPITDEESAALAVRELCGVKSRAELTPGSDAARRWSDLHGRFLAWKMVPA